jgi:hypothetical protein
MAVHPVWPSDSLQSVGIGEYLPLGQQGMYLTAQYPICTSPLSTLRRRPGGRLHMTRGPCGSLPLQPMKLSFTTPCRFNRRTETR